MNRRATLAGASDAELPAEMGVGPNDILGIATQPRPPSAQQAEQVLLGVMLRPGALEPLSYGVQAHHFVDPVHGAIFAEIAARAGSGYAADTLVTDSETQGVPALEQHLAEVGGVSYLRQLVALSDGDPVEAAKAVVDCWRRRRLLDITDGLRVLALSHGEQAVEREGRADWQAHALLSALCGILPDLAAISGQDAAPVPAGGKARPTTVGDGLPGMTLDGFEAAELARWHDKLAKKSRAIDRGATNDLHEARAAGLRRYAARWSEAAGVKLDLGT